MKIVTIVCDIDETQHTKQGVSDVLYHMLSDCGFLTNIQQITIHEALHYPAHVSRDSRTTDGLVATNMGLS
jgi:hypothetical protein